ncbi:putative transcription factor bZIP family [Arabidopsis thaliana]|uniref:BZIP domain-containing protein n=4 Tax=Arabidopsis TaxID=3701 RepID=A0A178VUT9_ARATH|nr:Basic-leucine zipper (bZIP) transcription factor family protein [Arabidopsis thaliana]KAG7636922.1 Basic-leucine zipper domain [Arabidopsis thaliana x Arabidopsis arenosa]KAG7641542.1 Basic-leucine zipper domain [Arabidopsis suecica]AEC07145.1 Basic-leucine zipper (bZIP) transcription factor family protein [Arabidopsis thaliana]OAP09161.1 hypothetical protein AXX17_AT2G16700 [Arabidopsis thaliana]CAA0368345.1 unnamed protein product [Arabidopsis thaliana]|eukprot:NP_850010.1 Basic-leucine zipper (bZIP) transcription factor family protein [Arabidopsis thaliana]
MNGRGNMTQYQQNPFSTDDGGQSTGVSLSSRTSLSPPLIRYPAGSPDFSPGPRCTTQPSPTFSDFTQASPSLTSFNNPASFTPSFSFSNIHQMIPTPSSSHNSKASVSSASSSSFYFPQTSPSSCSTPSSFSPDSFSHSNTGPWSIPQPSPVFSSIAPASSALSSFGPDSFSHSNTGTWSIPQPSPVFSSIAPASSAPPLFGRDSFPRSNRGKGSLIHRSPVLSVLPPAPVYSSNPMVRSSPPGHPSPSAHLEEMSNRPPLHPQPRVPVTRSNSAKVSGSRPRKYHKRTNSELSSMLVGDSSRGEEGGFGKLIYNEEAMKEFCSEYMIMPNQSAVNNSDQNRNADVLMITNTDSGGANDAKKYKRMLANRASAARSKENREKKIRDMELRVETLENTQASLFGTMTLLEKENIVMMNENKLAKIRLQLLEQQAPLLTALTKQLDELRRLEKEANERGSVDYSQLLKQLKQSEELLAEINRFKVATGQGMKNPNQFEGSTMHQSDQNVFQPQLNTYEFNQHQQLDPNIFKEQCNVNEFNHEQPNHEFYGHN